MNESFEIQFWDDPYKGDMIAHDDGDNHKGYACLVLDGIFDYPGRGDSGS